MVRCFLLSLSACRLRRAATATSIMQLHRLPSTQPPNYEAGAKFSQQQVYSSPRTNMRYIPHPGPMAVMFDPSLHWSYVASAQNLAPGSVSCEDELVGIEWPLEIESPQIAIVPRSTFALRKPFVVPCPLLFRAGVNSNRSSPALQKPWAVSAEA
jgi:hypothetical protein